MNSKWLKFTHFHDELKQIYDNAPQEYEDRILQLDDKFNRIYELKTRLDQEEYLLTKECMKLMKEKVVYASKINDIITMGDNLEWQERSKLLEKIRPLIEKAK